MLCCLLALCFLAWAASTADASEPPSVSWNLPGADNQLAAPEGHAWVKWTADSDQPVDAYLIERTAPDEQEPVLRQIEDTATFFAGMPEGTTELRVRALSNGTRGPWSETLRIEVSYPSMHLVWILGSLGTALLMATIALIVVGHRRFSIHTYEERADRRKEEGEDG